MLIVSNLPVHTPLFDTKIMYAGNRQPGTPIVNHDNVKLSRLGPGIEVFPYTTKRSYFSIECIWCKSCSVDVGHVPENRVSFDLELWLWLWPKGELSLLLSDHFFKKMPVTLSAILTDYGRIYINVISETKCFLENAEVYTYQTYDMMTKQCGDNDHLQLGTRL